jgi:hypothetical protein
MKKSGLLLTILLIVSLTACVNANVAIPYGVDMEDVVEVTSQEIAQRIEQGTPFLLYISSVTCSSCAEFRPILMDYIRETDLEVLKIEADSAFPTDNEWIAYQYTPTLVLYDGTKIVFHINALNNPKPFSSVDLLTKQLAKYIAKK